MGLFGTDGIRSEAGKAPLDLFNLEKIIRSYCIYLRKMSYSEVIIGSDTRISGSFITNYISGVLNFYGIDTVKAGIFTTPGIAFLCRSRQVPGIVISASHNPYYDNGLKFFDKNGNKMPVKFEKEVERHFGNDTELETGLKRCFGKTTNIKDKDKGLYHDGILHGLKDAVFDFENKCPEQKVLFDMANGAAVSAIHFLSSLPFAKSFINTEYDGFNINSSAGSEFIQKSFENIEGFDYLMAFDGDADRIIIMDREGFIYNGDLIMIIIAIYLSRTSSFPKIAAGTIMTSLSAENILKDFGYGLVRSDVGDRELKLKMDESNALIGAEPSGHIIFKDFLPTGDGLYVSLLFLYCMQDDYLRKILTLLKKDYIRSSKLLKNYPIKAKVSAKELYCSFKSENLDYNMELFNNSLVIRDKHDFYSVIRLSGTEPRLRIFIETDDESVLYMNHKRFVDILSNKNII